MKRFVNTAFIRMVKTDPNPPLSSLEEKYDAFAASIFERPFKKLPEKGKLSYHDALVYTHTELVGLLSEKKVCKQF
jgi:hypothetical protein